MLRKSLTIVIVLALVILFSQGISLAQPDTAWVMWYGGVSDEEAYSIQQTTDGGFIVVGYTTTFGGGGKDVWLVKIDTFGDTLWTRIYGGSQDDIGRSVRQTSDGGYIIAGQTNSFGAGNADLWLIKTDGNGDSLWAKTYGGSANDLGYSVRQTQDGGYIIVANTASFAVAYDDVWLLKTDSAGDTLWTKNWDLSGNDDRGAEVQQTHDGGYVVVGHSYYVPGGNILDCTLFRTDSQGSLLWTEIYGERADQRGASVDQTSDSGYVLTGYTAYSGMTNPDVYVVKTDSAGDTTWTRTYGGADWEEGYLVRQTAEGGYFIAGKANSFGAGGFDVWVLEMDSNGDTLWTRTYGGTSDDVGFSGQQTADGGYIMAGYTESFGAGGKDVFLIRLVYPRVISTSPAQNELNVAVSANISVTFNKDMDETTINDSTFVVNAWSTGLHLGMITYDAPTRTATFDPSEDFEEGEVITVALTTGIQSSGGTPLDSAFVWSFTTEVQDGMGVFAVDSVYSVEGHPTFICAADLDGDGDLDLATANESLDEMGVLLNRGDGRFTLDSTYHVYDGPQCVFAADLDADGDMDLATANSWSSNVGVFLNHGDGTFASVILYPVGTNPRWVFGADLDGDGHIDLITADPLSNNISIMFNNGDGSFGPRTSYPVADGPWALSAADLDADADLDLAITCSSSDNVWIMLNAGDGTFTPDSAYSTGDGPFFIVAADLDGDGDLDLVMVDAFYDNVSVLLNQGDGTFAPRSVYAVGDEPRAVSVSDVDGDGDLDLVVANHQSNDISVLLNNGDGTFAPQSRHSVVAEPYCLFVADLNGDGSLDVATANRYWNSMSVLFNSLRGDANGDGIINVGDIVYLVSYLYKNGPAPSPVEVGDCNCDGIVNVGDIVYLVSYLYKNGPPPGCP